MHTDTKTESVYLNERSKLPFEKPDASSSYLDSSLATTALEYRGDRVPTASRSPVALYRIPSLDEVFGSELPTTKSPPRSRAPRSPGPQMKKRRRVRYSKRPVYKRRRRIAFFILVLIATLAVVGPKATSLLSGTFEETNHRPLERVVTPTVEQEEPEPVAEKTYTTKVEEKAEEEEATEKEEAAEEEAALAKAVREEAAREEAALKEAAEKEEAERRATIVAPEDPTLYLTIPKLGMRNHTVRNENSEYALGLGAIKLPDTPFPWEKGPKNTYIACHRLGFPGTQSFHQCLNLPLIRKGDEIILKDDNGRTYEYRVSELLTTITPEDSWVMDPVAGRDMISLQTCLEAPGDFVSLGPNWEGRLIVRADRVI